MAAKKHPRRRAKAKTPKTRGRARRRAGTRRGSATALPTLEAWTTAGRPLKLSTLKGRRVVLYFYPKDDTPGCTREGCDFRDRHAEFARRNAVVLGVSRDGIAAHDRFRAKYRFPFDLVADIDEKLCRAFDVIKPKTLYGREYLGVERSTFVFDESGRLRRAFRGVKVPGHVQQVLEELDKL